MSKPITYLTRSLAQRVDEELMSTEFGFTLDQLMELAGLSVAMAIHQFFPFIQNNQKELEQKTGSKKILVWCGPGNNGGDGLVAGAYFFLIRSVSSSLFLDPMKTIHPWHLFHFGYEPLVFYPKIGKHEHFSKLMTQLHQLQIPIYKHEEALTQFQTYSSQNALILDALFGFSFSGQIRPPFSEIIQKINASNKPIVSVDIPSGWDVEQGQIHDLSIQTPSMLVSLTAPKLGVKNYQGIHVVGGRFTPPVLSEKLGIQLPDYLGSNQITILHHPLTHTI